MLNLLVGLFLAGLVVLIMTPRPESVEICPVCGSPSHDSELCSVCQGMFWQLEVDFGYPLS